MLGSWAMIWRYMPTPESSEGTALSVFALPTLGGPLVTEVFRTRLAGCCPPAAPIVPAAEVILALVLVSQPGLLETTEVMLPFVILESILRLVIVGDAGGPPVRLLAGRADPTADPTTLPS